MAYLTRRRTAPGILVAVVAFHAGLLLVLLSLRTALVASAPRDSLIYIALAAAPVIEVPLTPAPELDIKTPVQPASRPIVRPAPLAPKAAASGGERGPGAPPSHEFVAGGDWGSADSAAGAAGGAGSGGVRVPDDYAERVKARVVARLARPAGANYAASGKGSAIPVYRQCTIPYELVVDRAGKVLSFRIEPCGDTALDAAAEAALRQSGPHPPPPHAGAESYVIYGTANFKAP